MPFLLIYDDEHPDRQFYFLPRQNQAPSRRPRTIARGGKGARVVGTGVDISGAAVKVVTGRVVEVVSGVVGLSVSSITFRSPAVMITVSFAGRYPSRATSIMYSPGDSEVRFRGVSPAYLPLTVTWAEDGEDRTERLPVVGGRYRYIKISEYGTPERSWADTGSVAA